MKNYTEIENIYQVYQEGIFDRVGARLKGMANSRFLGGSGYNAGKAESFKGKFYDRIIQDIDKFLDEVQTMNGLKSLADFEAKYPEMARKIACMADAVGHKTGLTTQCTKPTTPVPPPPPVPGPERYSCKDGKCVMDPLGQYKTKEECEAVCKQDGGDDEDNITPPPPVKMYGYACNKKTGKCVKIEAVKQEGNSLRSAKGTYLYKTLEACKKKCKKNDGGQGGSGGGSRVRGDGQSQNVGRDNLGNMAQHSGIGDVYQANGGVTVNKTYYIIKAVKQAKKQGKTNKQAVIDGAKAAGVKPTPNNLKKVARIYTRNKDGTFAKKPTA